MSLLASEDSAVVDSALNACSRLMIEKWENVGNQTVCCMKDVVYLEYHY